MAAHGMTRLALQGSQGIWVFDGPPQCKLNEKFGRISVGTCKVMCFNENGAMFAYCDGNRVHVLSTEDYHSILELDKPRTASIEFSPKSTLIATWEPYVVTKDNPGGSPNLNIWNLKTGQHIRGLFQKKHVDWCPQWSVEEEICGRNVNNEIQFYEKNQFDTPVYKLHLQKVEQFRLTSKSAAPYHIAAYVPGSKGQPSFVRIYKYPNFAGPQAALANKSFYKADKIDLLWNNKGNGLLLITATESSAESYYGEQGLHYIGIDGESCLVPRQKNGPIYSAEWSPKSNEFAVVYGFMPAKVTLYNTKCEPVFDFGTGPRNAVYYNPHGSVLCLAGFGNLGGNMEFWDVKGKKLIGKTEARDSTYFEWSPDGKHVVTATTAPRLRVGNGFRFWDFLGRQIYEESFPDGESLFHVKWQTATPGLHEEPKIPTGGTTKVAAAQEADKPAAYVPPALRNKSSATAAAVTSKYRQEYEPASNVKQNQQAPENLSKAALKNKKKREAKAKARAAEFQTQSEVNQTPKQVQPSPEHASLGSFVASGDPEKDKKIRNLNKKLQQIQKLKEQQAAGKQLELNQIEKIKTEEKLLKDLEDLQLV